jgi:serine/threonine protein kinase/tetratricopeptide (TPR) repeat protein
MSINVGSVFGRYEIRSKIGAGGMGEVYKAEDRVLLRTVAIKFINKHRQPAPDSGKRFLREARAASGINHPNIVTIHEISETDDHAYIVMEYVEGRSLREHIRLRSFDLQTALGLAAQVADALDAAHARGVLHRDIKPENVIVNERGHVKLLDFGLARALEAEGTPVDEQAATRAFVESLTDAGSVIGTIPYMSPEQLRKQPLDARSDVFSFGVVLHEMLTGRHPFHAPSSFEVAALILSREAVRFDELEPKLPAGVVALLARLLEKERARRYSSFAEVKAALDALRTEATGGEPASQQAATRQLKISPVAYGQTGGLAHAPSTHQAASQAPSLAAPSLVQSAPKTILVLPLEAVGTSEESGFIGVGLASVITTELSKLNGLSVLSKSIGAGRISQTGQGARELAHELGATILLEGEVMRAGQMIRIAARLIDVESGRVIWGDQYMGEEKDIFQVQDGVCESIASALKLSGATEARHSSRDHTSANIDAFELYSKGRTYLERREVRDNIDYAIQMFSEALKLDPEFAPAQAGLGEAYWLKYEATREEVWVERALAASDHALVLDPYQPQVHVALGIVYHGTNRVERAIEEFERAIELQPLSDDAHRWLGRCYRQQGNAARAIEYFKKAIRIRPGFWDNYNDLGVCYYTLGRYEEAAEQFRRLITIQPDNFHGYDNLGAMYYLLGCYSDAAAMHERAIEINPRAGIAYSNLGTNLFYLEKFEEAADAYRKAVELEPANDVPRRNLGDTLLRLGKTEEARAQFERAVELIESRLKVSPDDATLLGRRAISLAKLGRTDEARRQIERATLIEPHNTRLMYQKAVVYSLTGDMNEALRSLERALASGYSRSEAARDPDLFALHDSVEYKSLFN